MTEETIEWVAREMTAAEGGFYASLDADSEGAEGKFYVWTEREIDAALGPDSAVIKTYYGVTPAGNFEGDNILHVPADSAVLARRAGISETALDAARDRARAMLGALRDHRVRPARDDKVIAAWNGLMLRAVSAAARAFGTEHYTPGAGQRRSFVRRTLVRPGGRVMRTHTAGVTKIGGYLDDHASVALGFLGLRADFRPCVVGLARAIATAIDEWFWDDAGNAVRHGPRRETLITRPRDMTDNAVPSGTSLTVDLYLQLAELLDDCDSAPAAVGRCSRRWPSRWRAIRRRSATHWAPPTWRSTVRSPSRSWAIPRAPGSGRWPIGGDALPPVARARRWAAGADDRHRADGRPLPAGRRADGVRVPAIRVRGTGAGPGGAGGPARCGRTGVARLSCLIHRRRSVRAAGGYVVTDPVLEE